MRKGKRTELTIRATSIRDLFQRRDFDPLTDDPGALWSITQIVDFSDLIEDHSTVTLRVMLPDGQVGDQTESIVRLALGRYCSQKIAETRLEFAAWRRLAWRMFLLALGFFAVSPLATAGVRQIDFLPEEVQTLAGQTLIIAGWVFMWQPLDDLLHGWWPIRERERIFRAISAMRLVVGEAGHEMHDGLGESAALTAQ
jgi:hypothetical protein